MTAKLSAKMMAGNLVIDTAHILEYSRLEKAVLYSTGRSSEPFSGLAAGLSYFPRVNIYPSKIVVEFRQIMEARQCLLVNFSFSFTNILIVLVANVADWGFTFEDNMGLDFLFYLNCKINSTAKCLEVKSQWK